MSYLYTFFGGILRSIYDVTMNYGWSIVLFALFAKLITIPISVTQHKSTQLMKAMGPMQEALQKKHAGNREKLNDEIFKLYQRYDYKPWASCLPLLLQFPIMIGLYGALRSPDQYVFTPEEYALVNKSFLWIADMTKTPIETYRAVGITSQFLITLVLPLIAIALTFYSQKVSSPPTNDQTRSTMMMMNAMVGIMVFTLNQGLCIYWVMQSLLTIIQTAVLTKVVKVKLPEPPARRRKKRPASGVDKPTPGAKPAVAAAPKTGTPPKPRNKKGGKK
ncbi:MAG: YidC/Oxa1 family membrane protein insertase [Eubacteriaceae bacterium]|nr:YidC/Oxa1 family membrane protein insertase [Eubacteriaceae bacterium]